MPITDGAVFAGYTVLSLLGTGGMGEVYLVQHPRLPRLEALKILPAGVSAETEHRKRFAREADIAASLWHPHIVAVHDRGEHEGQLWITMDYVEGTDAAQLMRDRYPRGMPPKDVLDIVGAIAGALDYAHERFLLHRDVKPANILLTEPRSSERRILLADFGIARDTNDINALTATNVAVGSVSYAAPEQLTGKALDGRADQYALACTTFHLLAGEPPFASSNPAVVIGNHLSSPPPQLGDLHPDLASIDRALAKAMAKEPDKRFNTCREFASALIQRGAGDDTQFAPHFMSPPSKGAPDAHPGSRTEPLTLAIPRRAAWIIGTLAALLAVGLVAFVGARLGQSQSADPSASPLQPSPTRAATEPQGPPRTVTRTASPSTVTQTVPSSSATQPGPSPVVVPPPRPARPSGDLGLATPMTVPKCNSQGIVVLGNVTTPGQYASGVQAQLDAHPGAYYLRTDQSCPSLRQASDDGNPIYTVFKPGGFTESELCSAVRVSGKGAYGKFLDYTHDPGYIPCFN